MEKILKDLDLKSSHPGTSTGLNWLSGGDRFIISNSPVDGKKNWGG